MLNIQCDGKKMQIQHNGQPQDLAIEMAMALAGIYNSLQTVDEMDAEAFRAGFVTCIMPDSPIWEKDHGQVTIKLPIKKGGAPTGQS